MGERGDVMELDTSFHEDESQIYEGYGLPFRPSLPVKHPVSLEEMTQDEFDAKMARGLAQAKTGEGVPAEDFFKKTGRH